MMSPFREHASLDHLKHQAKDLLRGLRAGDPDAQRRALDHLPRHRQGQEPKLTDAQLIVAREYGYVSWPRMKEHVDLLADPPEPEPEPEFSLAEQIVSVLLQGAMETPLPRFSLRREGVDILLVFPDGGCCHLAEWLPGCTSYGWHLRNLQLPYPTGQIWERLLRMSDLDDASVDKGTIKILGSGFPRMEWTFTVKRDGPNKLDFTLSLDRVDTTMPSV
jgi:hypothetical protein